MKKVKVGVLGSGDVGKVLAGGFVRLGHEVMVGSRDRGKLSEWVAKTGDGASAGTFAEAAAFGDILILATLGVATAGAIEMAGPANFRGKVVIDATNPLEFSTGKPRLSVGWTDSLGEQIQRQLPEARVVKAFNTVGNAHMIQPSFPDGPPDMFLCGDDADAKTVVGQVCQHFGWGVVDIGGIEGSRHLEPMCMVWVLACMRSGSWSKAFKLLTK
ncbi:MAG: NADPH-dependent F420 reductase [Acidobacteriota bacterium]